MKRFLSVLIISIFCSSSAKCQLPEKARYWSYELPIVNNQKDVFNKLLHDKRFRREGSSNRTDSYRSRGGTYVGIIIQLNLPSSLKNVDSATIEWTWGFLSNTGSTNASKTYSGFFKILRLEYFAQNSVLLDQLFDASVLDLKEKAIHANEVAGKGECKTNVEKGIELVYSNNKFSLQKVTILKKACFEKKASLLLEFQVDSK